MDPLKKFVLGGVSAALLVWGGLLGYISFDNSQIKRQPLFRPPLEHKVSRYPVDQIFRDFNGYRVFYTDGNNENIERFYSTGGEVHSLPNIVINGERFKGFRLGPSKEDSLRIFKDLAKGERGYADQVVYKFAGGPRCVDDPCSYTEVHLPLEARISAGIATDHDSHNPKHFPMQEIK